MLTDCRNGQVRELFSSFRRSKPSEGSGSYATSAFQAYLKPRHRAATALTALSVRSNSLAHVILTRQSIGCRCKNIRRRDEGLTGRFLAQIQGKSTDRRYGRLHPSEGLGITIPPSGYEKGSRVWFLSAKVLRRLISASPKQYENAACTCCGLDMIYWYVPPSNECVYTPGLHHS